MTNYPVPAIPLRIRYMDLSNVCSREDSFSISIEQLRYYRGPKRQGPYWSMCFQILIPITQRARDYLTLPRGMYDNKWR